MSSLSRTTTILHLLRRCANFRLEHRRGVRASIYSNQTEFYPMDLQPQEPDIPLKEYFNFTHLVKHTKLALQEYWDEIYAKRTLWQEVGHEQMMIQWKFDCPEAFEKWNVTADSDSKQGHSQSELLMSKRKTAIFRGTIDTKAPNDGKTTYAGFASMKVQSHVRSFDRKAFYNEWSRFSHLILKIRGDGRNYAIVLNTPGKLDQNWHDFYTYPLYTHGGPYWQYAKIPFSKFFFAVHGRIQDRQEPMIQNPHQSGAYLNRVNSLSISIYDRNDGPFQLEIDYIGVYNDTTHFEEFAYEMYKTPFAYK